MFVCRSSFFDSILDLVEGEKERRESQSTCGAIKSQGMMTDTLSDGGEKEVLVWRDNKMAEHTHSATHIQTWTRFGPSLSRRKGRNGEID